MTFGKKKHAIAVVVCHKGKGLIKCNGVPINLIHPSALRIKEPILIAGKQKFRDVDIRVRVRGGQMSSQETHVSLFSRPRITISEVPAQEP